MAILRGVKWNLKMGHKIDLVNELQLLEKYKYVCGVAYLNVRERENAEISLQVRKPTREFCLGERG